MKPIVKRDGWTIMVMNRGQVLADLKPVIKALIKALAERKDD